MTIGQRILDILNNKKSIGLNAAGLARHIGTNHSTVTGWKEANKNPSSKYLLSICEYLDVSANFLLSGKENDSEPKLSEDEITLIERYRLITNEEKELIRADLLTKVIKLRD